MCTHTTKEKSKKKNNSKAFGNAKRTKQKITNKKAFLNAPTQVYKPKLKQTIPNQQKTTYTKNQTTKIHPKTHKTKSTNKTHKTKNPHTKTCKTITTNHHNTQQKYRIKLHKRTRPTGLKYNKGKNPITNTQNKNLNKIILKQKNTKNIRYNHQYHTTKHPTYTLKTPNKTINNTQIEAYTAPPYNTYQANIPKNLKNTTNKNRKQT